MRYASAASSTRMPGGGERQAGRGVQAGGGQHGAGVHGGTQRLPGKGRTSVARPAHPTPRCSPRTPACQLTERAHRHAVGLEESVRLLLVVPAARGTGRWTVRRDDEVVFEPGRVHAGAAAACPLFLPPPLLLLPAARCQPGALHHPAHSLHRRHALALVGLDGQRGGESHHKVACSGRRGACHAACCLQQVAHEQPTASPDSAHIRCAQQTATRAADAWVARCGATRLAARLRSPDCMT